MGRGQTHQLIRQRYPLRRGVGGEVLHLILNRCSSRRDVPPERLYKVLWIAEKGGSRPGFGISCALGEPGSQSAHKSCSHLGELHTLVLVLPGFPEVEVSGTDRR